MKRLTLRRNAAQKSKKSSAARALAPFGFILEIALGFTVLGPLLWGLFLLPLLPTFLGMDIDFDGLKTCVSAPAAALPHTPLSSERVSTGIDTYATVANRCIHDPSASQIALGAVGNVLPTLFMICVLLMLYRSVQQAMRRGLFEAGLPRRLIRTGLLVSVGQVVTSLTTALTDTIVLDPPSGDAVMTFVLCAGHRVSFWWVVAGLGLITLGRVMRFAVVLREEYMATSA